MNPFGSHPWQKHIILIIGWDFFLAAVYSLLANGYISTGWLVLTAAWIIPSATLVFAFILANDQISGWELRNAILFFALPILFNGISILCGWLGMNEGARSFYELRYPIMFFYGFLITVKIRIRRHYVGSGLRATIF